MGASHNYDKLYHMYAATFVTSTPHACCMLYCICMPHACHMLYFLATCCICMPHAVFACHMLYLHATCCICLPHAVFACHMLYLHATCCICMPHAVFACHMLYLHATCCICMPHCLQVTLGGRAMTKGLVAGDYILTINGTSTKDLKHLQAQQLIKTSKLSVELHW